MDHGTAHARTPADVLDALDTTDGGLSADDARARLERDGPNELPSSPPDPAWLRLARHFNDVLIYVLLAAAVLKAALGEWVDFGVILTVAVVNAVIGFVQEGRAAKALEGLRDMLSLTAEARRDGDWVEVEAAELVVGDVVRLRSGDRIPADLRLVETNELRAEESGLTGESEPVDKRVDAVDDDAELGDRASMAYSGSLVAAGRGVGVVTATGADTQIGRISSMMDEADDRATPLERQIQRFSILLSKIILATAVFLMAFGWTVHDMEIALLLTAAVAFAVAAIPEGLPAVVTITLARGVRHMARRNAITRSLNAVETLGSVTVICSDKTGTLTRNEMTVQRIVTPARRYEVEGIGYEPRGQVRTDDRDADLGADPDLEALVRVNAAANDASLSEEDGAWQLLGEPTEGALVTLAAKVGIDTDGITRRGVVPFESEHKLMATLDELEDGSRWIHVKGAPDRILERCSGELRGDGSTGDLDVDTWSATVDELSDRGLRVLAAAQLAVDGDREELSLDTLQDLVFVGVVGILDPPRPEATEAVAEAKRAGIRVKMITGDHAGTATAIGREMGIIDPDDPASEGHADRAITGRELDEVDDEELRDIADRYDTFARVSPEHKLRLVRALQASGEVVAMTGDGVNDAPALRQADVGVAMGIKGTEATKEAASIVLADDNFATIERAVEEGRRTFDNIQKSIVFLLPTNGAQSLVLLTAVLFGLALPLEPVQILWVNLIAAITLSLALAFEPAEPDIMRRPPRPPDAGMVERSSIVLIVLASLLIGGATLGVYAFAGTQDLDGAQQQTIAVTMLAVGQIAYLFNCRNLRGTSLRPDRLFNNPVAWLSVGALLLLQALFVYVPVMHTLFGSAPIGGREWAITAAAAIAILLVVEVAKSLLVRRETAGSRPTGPG
ncbi:MAG: HAD-IC family P-type ATPase [Nitriliruptoraceae bacterium]|nr:HAD-IC family P-type ATPase [Nitriliruptoraceae bacterium]